jgi:hypothetical protein
MAEIRSPLYIRTVACPACGTKTSQPDFKTGMYVEEERETDQHVTRYRWPHPEVTPVHPPYYALAHCPHCAFTDFKEDFLEPARSRENRARLIAPRLQAEVTRRGSAIGTLRQSLRLEAPDFPTAIRLHLLAIALQELLPEDRRDHLKLARLFLRTAWLYREQGDGAHPSPQDGEGLAALDQCATSLRELEGAVERLVTVYAGKAEAPRVATFAKHLEGLGEGYADLRADLLARGDGGNPLSFLTLLRGEWPGIPASEACCLEAAVAAFERVYAQGEGDTLVLLKLMIELNYRLGHFDRVLEYAASMSKSGHDERIKLQRQLNDRSLSAEERNRLTVRINRIGATLQLASEIRHDVLARQAATPAV